MGVTERRSQKSPGGVSHGGEKPGGASAFEGGEVRKDVKKIKKSLDRKKEKLSSPSKTQKLTALCEGKLPPGKRAANTFGDESQQACKKESGEAYVGLMWDY